MDRETENGEQQVQADEQAQELIEAVRVSVDDWVDQEDSSAKRVEGQIIIEEEELIKKVAMMVGMTADKFSE